MRYSFIQAEKGQYPVAVLCRVMAVARSGFYAWCQRPLSATGTAESGLLLQIQAGSPGIPMALRESSGSSRPV